MAYERKKESIGPYTSPPVTHVRGDWTEGNGWGRVCFSLNFCALVCAVIVVVLEPRIVLDSPFLLTTLEA